MSISIADPFLLSTYTSSKRPAYPEGSPGPSKYTNVYATQEHASTSESASSYVTVTVQGEGVHVLDTSTLRPAISHTLGPSVAYACPPATETTQEDNARICTTYVVVETSQDVPSKERGRTVWMWKDSPTGKVVPGTEPHAKQRTRSLSHRVSRISVSRELPRHALFVGTRGELTITDNNLEVVSSYTPSDLLEESSALHSFVFPRQRTTFGPVKSTPKQGLLSVIISHKGVNGRVDVLAVDDKASVTSLGSFALPPQKTDIVDVTCSEEGWISVITRSGEWNAYQLETTDNTTISLIPRATIPLKHLTFVVAAPTPAVPLPPSCPHEISILSLGSSHVLLAGVNGTGNASASELAFLLWDLRYSVLLASHLFALPSSVVRTRKHGLALHMEGSSMHASQLLLTLTSRVSIESSSAPDTGARRASVLIMPVTVPPTSTIAAAVGRASAGRWWIVPGASTVPADAIGSPAEVKMSRAVQSMLGAKKIPAAEEAFFAWVKTEEDVKTGAAQTRSTKMSRELVKRLLEAIFPLPPLREKRNDVVDPTQYYSSKIVRCLLKKGVVSSTMVTGGLLTALRLCNDWDAVVLAIKTVRDIPEADLMSVLHASVVQHRRAQPGDEAMQIDSGVPLPSVVLSLCVSYAVSLPALRLALRQHLRDADELTYLLQILAGWLATWTAADVSLLPAETKEDAHGALVPVYPVSKLDVPPVDKVLTFTQCLLDTSFLTLLAHPPAHALLRGVLAHIEPELGFMDDAAQLHGVLQPFVKAHAQAVHEKAHGPARPDLSVDWRRRRKEAHDQAAIAVGVYQIEELVL